MPTGNEVTTILRLKADSNQAQQSVNGYKASLVKAKTAEKGLKKATADTGKAMKKQGETITGLVKAHAGSIVSLGALTKAVQLAGSEIKRLTQLAKDWDGSVGGLGDQTRALAETVDGMISEQALSRVAELGQQLGWTREQQEALTKKAIEYGRINKVDFAESLKLVTNQAVAPTAKALLKLGINIDLSKNKAIASRQVLDAYALSTRNTTVQVENLAEAQDKLNNTQEAAEARYSVAISGLIGLGTRAKEAAAYYDNLANMAEIFGDKAEKASLKALRAMRVYVRSAGTWTAIPKAQLQAIDAVIAAVTKQREVEIEAADDARKKTARIRQEQAAEIDRNSDRSRKRGAAEAKRRAAEAKREAASYAKFLVKTARESRSTIAKINDAFYEQELDTQSRLARLTRSTAAKDWKSFSKSQDRKLAALDGWIDGAEKRAKKSSEFSRMMTSETSGMFSGLVSGIVSTTVAAGESGEAWSEVAARALDGWLGAKSIEWSYESAAHLARYISSWGTDVAALKSAGIYAGLAASAGVGAAVIDSGGGGAGGSVPAAGAGTGASGGTSVGTSATGGGGGGNTTIEQTTTYIIKGRGAMITRKDLRALDRQLRGDT